MQHHVAVVGVGRNLYFDCAKTRSKVSKDISHYDVCVWGWGKDGRSGL